MGGARAQVSQAQQNITFLQFCRRRASRRLINMVNLENSPKKALALIG